MKVQLQDGSEIDFIDFPQEIHPERLFAVQQVELCGGGKILDVGCGRHKTVSQALGVDIMPVTDIQASADDLHFAEDDTYDCIISRHSLEHLLDPVKTLREWIRILKPGGRIIFVLPDHSKVQSMSYPCSAGTHLHAYSPDSFRNLLKLFSELRIDLLQTVIENWSFGSVVTYIGDTRFRWMNSFRHVLITGPQRSGTRICAKIIAHDCGYDYIDEAEIETADPRLLHNFLLEREGLVIQCPAAARAIQFFNGSDRAIVMMFRNLEDIIRSQERIGWQGEKAELMAYHYIRKTQAECKWAYWNDYQRTKITHPFEIHYEDLKGHPLWIDREHRKDFAWNQTVMVETK